MDYQLVVLKGRSAVQAIRLADGVTTVGRQEGCELTVRSSQVSRKHCQLFEKKGLLLVKDLGSSNGTFVNSDRVEDQRVLEPGDVLTVGPIQFRVEKAVGAGPAPSGPQAVKPSDTAVPAQPVEAPIPLDDDDVLDFITDDEPTKVPGPAKPPKAEPAKKAKAAEPARAAEPAKAKKAAAKPPEPAPEPEEGADEAVAEFLMNIELDDDARG